MSSTQEFPEDETVIQSQGTVLRGSNVDHNVELPNATGTNVFMDVPVLTAKQDETEKDNKVEVPTGNENNSQVASTGLEEQATLSFSAPAASTFSEQKEAPLPPVLEHSQDCHDQKATNCEKKEDYGNVNIGTPVDSPSVEGSEAHKIPDGVEREVAGTDQEKLVVEKDSNACTLGEMDPVSAPEGADNNSEASKTNAKLSVVEKESATERTVSSDSKSTSAERSQLGVGANPVKDENTSLGGTRDTSSLSSSVKPKVIGKNEKLERKMALLAKLNEVESRKLKYMEKKNTPSSSPLETASNVNRMSPPSLDIQAASMGEYSESRAASSPQDSERDKSRSLRPRTPGNQRNSAKLAVSPRTPNNDYKEDPLYCKCKNVLRSLMERKDVQAFVKPVDELFTPEEIPGYFDIIKHPMDLGTVLYRMELGLYRHPTVEEFPKYSHFDLERFKADVRLVWENAMTYNLQGTPYHMTAAKLSETFERKLEAALKTLPETKMYKSKERKRQTVSRSTNDRPMKKANTSSIKRKATSDVSSHKTSHHSLAKTKHVSSTNAATTTVSTDKKGLYSERMYSSFAAASHASMTAESPSTSIQKLQEKIKELERIQARMACSRVELQSQDISSSTNPLVNVPMTYEEKRKLGDNINLLPGDKLAKVVQIIMRHKGSTPVNDREEIEIDIDALDTRTLREMEAFVQSALQKRVPRKKSSPLGETFTTQTSSVTSELENLREQLRNLQGTNYEMGMTLESGQTVSATSGGGGGGQHVEDKGFTTTGHAEESGNNELSTVPESSNRDSSEQKQQQEEQMYSSDDSDSTSDTASVSDN